MESIELNEEKQVKKPVYDKYACMKAAMCKCMEGVVEIVNELYQGRKPRAVSEEVIAIKMDNDIYYDVVRTAKGLEIEDREVNTENVKFLYKLATIIGDKIANETDKGYVCSDMWCSFNRCFDSSLRLGIIAICKNDKEKINIPLILNKNYSLSIAEEKESEKFIDDTCEKLYINAMQECIWMVVNSINSFYYKRIPKTIDRDKLLEQLDGITSTYLQEMKKVYELGLGDRFSLTEDIEFLVSLAIELAEYLTMLYSVKDKIILVDNWYSYLSTNKESYTSGNVARILTINEVFGTHDVRVSAKLNDDGKYRCNIVPGKGYKDNIRIKIEKEGKNMEDNVNKYYIQDSVNLLYDMCKGYEVIAKDFLETLQAVITNKPEGKGNSILNTLILLHGQLESIYSTYGTFGTKIRCIDRADILSIEYINSLCKDEFDIAYDNEGFKLKLTNYHTLYVKEEKIITQLNEDLLLNKYKVVLEVDIEDLYDYEKDTIDLLKKISQEGMVCLKFEPEDGLIPSSFVHKLKLTKDRKSYAGNKELPNVMYYAIPKDLSRLDTYPPIYLYEDIEAAIEFKRNAESVIKNTETLEDMQELVILTAYVVKKK